MRNFRFAIMGAGRIAEKFTKAVALIENCSVQGVASKSMEKAKAFAGKNNIENFYDSYEEMLMREKPDCVYIATVPSSHYELCKLCLKHNTAVLCEKAMFMNSKDAEKIFNISKEKNVFAMEAMWSYFLPAVNKVKEWIDGGEIGNITIATAEIGFTTDNDVNNRYLNPEIGGGARFDITVYTYELMRYFIEKPIGNKLINVIWGKTGVDVTDHIVLEYDDAAAFLTTSVVGRLSGSLSISGDNGRIVLPSFQQSKEAFLYGKDKELKEHFIDDKTTNGFVYEIEEAVKCINNKQYQSIKVPHALTLDCTKLFDEIEKLKK